MRDKIEEKHRLLSCGEFDVTAYLDRLIKEGRIDFANHSSLIDYYIESNDSDRPVEPILTATAVEVVAPAATKPPRTETPPQGDIARARLVNLDALNALERTLARQPSALEFSDFLFDPLAYLMDNRDLEHSPLHLVDHYTRFGFAEGRSLPSNFDTDDYLQRYPDIRAAGMIAIDHLLRHGLAEGRTLRPLAKPRPSSGARRFCDLQRLVENGEENAGLYGRLIARWWRDFQTTIVTASLANNGWVGDKPMPLERTYFGLQDQARAEVEPAHAIMTDLMQKAFYENLSLNRECCISELLLQKRAASRAVKPQPARSVGAEGVSLITPFFHHRAFFEECAASVDLLRDLTTTQMPELAFEWILVNDDLSVPMEALRAAVPATLRPYVKFVQGGGLKTTGATNLGIEHASNGWLLFLDCDDIILPNAILALDHYSKNFANRYFASGMIDIDADNRVMRYRQHSTSSLRAPNVGMNAGHLKYVHRSLFEDYGPLDSTFDGCQDYEFLLRILDNEDIVLIPEYMYMYRWHSKTQSVSAIVAQEQKAALARKIYARGRHVRRAALTPEVKRVAALIRTTGERPDSLEEAILSCRSLQTGAVIEPVVIVHGNDARFAYIRDHLADLPAHVVHAPDTKRSRGYPLNIGAQFAFETLNCDGFGVLDDDDIYLPGMHQMASMVEANRTILHAGRVLRKSVSGAVDEPYKLMPAAQLTTSNFLPTNGFIVTKALAATVQDAYGDLFPTDMFYLEDYTFLLRAWGSGGEVACFDAFVGEFRMGSDGNTAERKFPFEFQRCAAKARVLAKKIADNSKARRAASLDSMPQQFARRITTDEAAELIGTIYQ